MLNSEMLTMPAMETPETTMGEAAMEQTKATEQVLVDDTDDEQYVAELERYPDVRHELSKAQLEAREQRRIELEQTFKFEDYNAVRKEMHASLYDASVTIREKSITFNQPCIGSLDGVSYVQLYFSETLGRLAVKPVSRNTPHAMHWCADGKNGRKPRTVNCPDLTKLFRETMGWEKGIRYKVLGYLIEVDGEMVYVFDFKYAKMYRERRRDANGQMTKVDRKGFYPKDAIKTMTVPAEEFSRSIAVENTNGLINAAMLIGADKLEPKAEETAQEDQKVATEAETAQDRTTTAAEPTEAPVAPVTANQGIRGSYPTVNGMAASSASKPALVL